MNLDALAPVAVHRARVVAPDDFLAERHLVDCCPVLVKQEVAVVQEFDVVMPGVPGLGAGGSVRPKGFALGVTDRDDVLSVGSTRQDQAFRIGRSACACENEDTATRRA